MVDVFIGRDREREALRAGLDSTLAGRGRLFLISGEPGIGKSRLAEELSAEAAGRGMRVVWGRSWEGGGAPAYWPIIQVLRGCAERPEFAQMVETLGSRIAPVVALVPEIVPSGSPRVDRSRLERLDPVEGRFRLFDGVAMLLKSFTVREPLLVVIDDLHEADGSTLQMLQFLARELKSSPLMLIGTHRLGEVERSPELRAAIGEIAREGSPIVLSGLTRSQVAEVVRARSGLSADDRLISALHSATIGNPLFLGGVLQSLLAEGKLDRRGRLAPSELTLPVSIRATIQKNFSLLSERTNSMLVNAAGLGAEFAIAPLAELAGASAQEVFDCLDEAAGLRVIIEERELPRRYRFAHPLLREVLYENLSTARKIELHAKIAQLLESAIGSDPSPARLSELAHHCVRAAVASDPPSIERALEYSLRAGTAADDLCATQEAIALYEAGLGLPRKRLGEETRARLLAQAATCKLFSAGLSKTAVEECEAAIDAFDRLGLSELAAKSRIDLATQLAKFDDENLTDVPHALKLIEHADRALERDSDSELVARLYVPLMRASLTGLDMARASAAYQRGIEITRRMGASVEEGHLRLLRRQLQAYAGQIGDAVGPQADNVQPASNVGLWTRQLIAPILIRWRIWDPVEVEELIRDQVPETVSANVPIVRRRLLLEMAIAQALAGNLEATRRLNFADAPDTLAFAIVACHEGDWNRAQRLFERGLIRARAAGAHQCEADWIFWYARILRVRGNTRRATRVLRDAIGRFGNGSVPLVEMWFRPELALIEAGDGNGGEAESNLARCREILSSGEDWRGLEGAVIRAETFAFAFARSVGDAVEGFERAIGIFQRYSLPWEEAETLQLWARALDRANEKTAAAQKLDAAVDIYRRIGAGQAWIDRAEAVLRSLAGAKGSTESSASSLRSAIFRKEGEYWTVAYQGTSVRLRNRGGLRFIGVLLSRPGKQLSAVEIFATHSAGIGAPEQQAGLRKTGDLGDAGEQLDAHALHEYRHRIAELESAIERAEQAHDSDAAARANAELDVLREQVGSGMGAYGRLRRVASHRERARVNVTRQIKSAIDAIRKVNPALARHLSNSIYTGNFCRYAPTERVEWRL